MLVVRVGEYRPYVTKCAAEFDWSWNLPYFNSSQRGINDYHFVILYGGCDVSGYSA